jgi:hypothetical protein
LKHRLGVPFNYLITPRVAAGKTTTMFSGNMKLFLFKIRNIKDQYLKITTLAKI